MKKRILGILLSICMVLSIMPAQVFAVETTVTVAEDSDGDGYVEIDTAEKLWWFTQQVNDGNNSLNAELTANIDLSGTCGEGIGNWQPIGNKYSGHFNGQGFTISNLYISSDSMYVGLFGYVKGATIENVTVTGSVYSTADMDDSYDMASSGGIVAYLEGGTIRNCHVNMTVSGEMNIGGICGTLDGNGLIENCTSRGSVIHPGASEWSGQALGGIVGYIWDGATVQSCTNYATVSSLNGAYMGGIAAFNYGTIENCFNYSNLISHEGVYDALGGIAECNGDGGIIRNCGNHGNISGFDVGGIVCQNIGAVENCYNIGTVSGTSGNFVGPISGLNQGDGTTTNNYYLSETTTEDGGRTAEQFASGQVTYELNGSTTTDESVWKQTLGTDSYPTLTGDNVYYGTPYRCDGILLTPIYSNAPISESVPPHTYDDGGLCSVCGTQAIASVTIGEEVNFYLSFADAIAKAEEGSEPSPAVIKLITDITVDEAVTMTGGYATLDLNGHTLTFTATNDTPFTLIAGTFTIRDSSTAQTGTIYHDVRGNEERTVIALTDSTALVLESGTLDFSAVTAAIAVEDGSIMQQRGGKITTPILLNNGRYELDDGTIETTYPYAFIIDSDGSAWYYIEITGGMVSVKDTLGDGGLLDFPQNGCTETLTITGGTFKNTSGNPFKICVYHSDAQLLITGGTFEQGLVCTSLWGDDTITLASVLESGYAFYDANGNLVVLADGQTEINEKVTVGVCTHIDSNTDHICEACGETLSQCADENNDHKCDVCGTVLSECTGGTSTCVDKAICTVCGQPYGELTPDAHTEINPSLVPNGVLHHNVVWSCCDAVVTENVTCVASNADGSCLTAETCVCGNLLIGAKDNHKLTYTASGNVITETCGWTGCEHTATATLHAPENPVYDGTQKLATVIYSDGWAGYSIDAISYSGTANDGSSYAGILRPAVKAGTVTASITAQSEDYTVATASVDYTIEKATPVVGTVSVAGSEAIYPHTAITLARTDTSVPGTLALDAGQTLMVGTQEYNWTFTPDEPHNYNAVTGKVSITVVEDTVQGIKITTEPTKTEYTYGDTFDKTGMVVTATYASGATVDVTDLVTIESGILTPTTMSVSVSYGGFTVAQSVMVNPMVIGKTNMALTTLYWEYTGEPVTVYFTVWGYKFEEIPASEYTVTYSNNTEIGQATVTFSDNPGGNYEVNASLTFNIVEAELKDVSASQSGTLTYTGNAQTPTVNASATTVDGAAVTFTYCLTEDGTYTAELPTFTNAGTYTVYFKANAERHEESSGSFEIVVGKATNTWETEPSIKGWTYGEYENTPTATPKFGSVGLSSFSYRLKGTVAWTNNPPSDAGIYEMRTRVQASDNWELLETTIEFEIKKAIPTVDTFDFTPPANLVCDGLAKEATVTVKEAIEGVGSVTIKYFKDGVELTGAPTAVGTYTVQIDVAEGANFKPATLTDEAWTFTVVEHDPGCHMDANKDMICDGCGMEASVMFDPYKVLIMKGYSSPDWFFVSLYLDSETTEEACENGSEYAIYPDTKTVYAVVTNGDQTETKTVAIDIVYQVEITWTETEFTYVDGEWNPETHEQTGGWEGSCEITLTNTGTMPVDYELTYTSVVEGITGVFSTTENPTAALASGSLDIGDVKNVAFKPEGRPPRDLNDEKIGTLTVKLGGD